MSVIRTVKKFALILSKHQKFRIFELAILMVLAGFIEMLSVSLILPFMEAVMNRDKFMSNSYVRMICDILNIQSYRTFLVLLAILMAIIYILKNAFLLFQMMVQNRFVNNNRFTVQKRLLSNYLSRPYEFFLDVKSGDVIQIVNNDTSAVFGLLTTLLSFFSETVVSVALIGTIIVIAPGITLAVALLMFVMVAIIQVFFRPRLQKIGMNGRLSSAALNQWLIQSIQGIKEIKIMRREKFFKRKFAEIGDVAVRSAYLYSTLSVFPRFIIEAVSMATFFIVIAAMIYRGIELESVVPMLSGIAMAAIRLLPSINRISSCLATLSYNEPSLDKMCEKLREMDEYINIEDDVDDIIDNSDENDSCGIIDLRKISYRYPKGEKYILRNADMEIKQGESIGIIGPSGAGKTTAMDIIIGLLRPSEGDVLYKGKNIRLDMEGWLNHVGYIPQTIFMMDGNIRENVAFGVPNGEIDDNRIWEVLKEAAIDDFIKSLPDGLDTELGEHGIRLSGGQRQRIGIARALYSNPEILFFDEATSALDNDTEKEIMESINGLHGSKTLIIIAHRLTTIKDCDHVFRVENQRIIQER